MTNTPLIPQSFWFCWHFGCRRDDSLPREGGRTRLLDLPRSCTIPALATVEGREPWAHLRAAWSPAGLAIAAEVQGKIGPIRSPDPEEPDFGDSVQLWIDTRDTRDIHRATRYCHRFMATLVPAARGSGLEVRLAQRPIHRAIADAPQAPPGSILHRAERLKDGWLLELFFRASSLNGYDPDTNRRLGLMVEVNDPDRGDQHLGVGREFPVGEDPSLWSTLVLDKVRVDRGS